MFPVEESVFLKEIPPELVEKRRTLFNPAYQTQNSYSRGYSQRGYQQGGGHSGSNRWRFF